MGKISTLPADSAPSSDDYIVVNDATSGQTKKVLLSDLFGNALIPTAGLANNAVTSAKIETQQAWITPTFLNSWVKYDTTYNSPQYMKDSMGFVHIKGMIAGGSSAGATMFVLPAGYRPILRILLGTQSAAGYARLDIQTDGTVALIGSGSTSWTSLEGITFKAEL